MIVDALREQTNGLEGIDKHYSYGDITESQVSHIYDLAEKHGFSLGEAQTVRNGKDSAIILIDLSIQPVLYSKK